MIKMYSNFYHTLMSPTTYSEWDGSYLGTDEQVHYVAPGENYYSDMSLWDTYRTQNPWLVLLRPDVARDVANSLVLMIEQGVNLPQWYAKNDKKEGGGARVTRQGGRWGSSDKTRRRRWRGWVPAPNLTPPSRRHVSSRPTLISHPRSTSH